MTMIQTNSTPKEILTNETFKKLNKMFCNEDEYKGVMQNLYKTRKGLYEIATTQPQFKEVVKPQFDVLNNLIDAFLNHDLEHPIYE